MTSLEALQSQLQAEIAPQDWQTLKTHAQRDALIVVEPSLDLIAVGVAIAADQVSQVQTWIDGALLHKPYSQELSQWNQQPQQTFRTLIVQPFILIQA
jgi:hypothetical protein